MIHYNPKLKDRARKLRKESTLSEVLLWNQLKGKQIDGYQFMRQEPIDNYIVDFFCSKLKLIIEIDGVSHIGKEKSDLKREEQLKSMGFSILRFCDLDIKTNMEEVIDAIYHWININKKLTTPWPPLLRGTF